VEAAVPSDHLEHRNDKRFNRVGWVDQNRNDQWNRWRSIHARRDLLNVISPMPILGQRIQTDCDGRTPTAVPLRGHLDALGRASRYESEPSGRRPPALLVSDDRAQRDRGTSSPQGYACPANGSRGARDMAKDPRRTEHSRAWRLDRDRMDWLDSEISPASWGRSRAEFESGFVWPISLSIERPV
jgi:hypothetical protein